MNWNLGTLRRTGISGTLRTTRTLGTRNWSLRTLRRTGISGTLRTTRTTNPKQKPDEDHLVFGQNFTDHMFVMEYDEGKGWHDGRII
ncbi:MAG: hypothetical protein PHO44_02135, partial [Sphaerochaetaceae bacterium]|nr:hypothetical protein [Sphaerochaetaceae bacterium]